MYRIIGADGNEYGPVSAEQVRAWITEGRANHTTRIRMEASAEWKTLGELPEFASAFAPPSAPPPLGGSIPPAAAPVNPDLLAQEILSGGVAFSISDCFSRGWNLVMQDFWPIIGVNALMFLILTAANGMYVGIFLNGVVIGGLYCYFLRRIRNQPATLNDAFTGFALAFVPLMLASLVSSLLTVVGFLCCIIPGIYLTVAWAFTFPLVMDKRLEFWPAMELSRKVVNRVWWGVFGFLILTFLINLLGFLLLCVGVFFTSAVTMAASAYAYESIFNRPKRPAA
jgi:uncharacterized membrane protein